MPRNIVVLLDNPEGQSMIKETLESHGLKFGEFQELLQAEASQIGKQRRRGLTSSFDDILDRIQIDD